MTSPRTRCQNHPLSMPYPVPRLRRPKDVLPTMSTQRRSTTVTLATLGFVLLCFAVIVAVNAADTPALAQDRVLSAVLIGGAAAVALLLFAIALALVLRSGNARVEGQLTYYALGEVPEPTEEQLQALSLVAFACYPFGHWTETLETLPAERRVQHVPQHRQRLAVLPIVSIQEFREDLDEAWGVLSPVACHRMIDSLLSGLHTAQFAATWELGSQPEREDFRDRLVSLSGLTVADFDACFIRDRHRPPQLIWAWDLWRAIQLARMAYGADLFTEDEAWTAILRASELAHALYPDYRSYRRSAVLGHAMWSNSLEAANERREMFEKTERNDYGWPINSVPWRSTTVEFPSSMADGFAMEIELSRVGDEDGFGLAD